ncbi:hypothetical protein VPH35_134502 [Triticum aestivum]
MQNALLKLWEMFEDSRTARRKDNLESSLTIHHLKEEKRNLDANYDKLVEDVHQLLMLMNLIEAQGTVIRNMKMNHLKEKEKLAEGNNNLKIQVDELTKSLEKVTEENVLLNLHMYDLKRGHKNLIKRRDEVKLQLAVQLKSLEKSKEKLKLIHDILKE